MFERLKSFLGRGRNNQEVRPPRVVVQTAGDTLVEQSLNFGGNQTTRTMVPATSQAPVYEGDAKLGLAKAHLQYAEHRRWQPQTAQEAEDRAEALTTDIAAIRYFNQVAKQNEEERKHGLGIMTDAEMAEEAERQQINNNFTLFVDKREIKSPWDAVSKTWKATGVNNRVSGTKSNLPAGLFSQTNK